MSDENEQVPADSGESPAADKLTQGMARFARYTAPTMLAMLASGKNAAFAASPPPP